MSILQFYILILLLTGLIHSSCSIHSCFSHSFFHAFPLTFFSTAFSFFFHASLVLSLSLILPSLILFLSFSFYHNHSPVIHMASRHSFLSFGSFFFHSFFSFFFHSFFSSFILSPITLYLIHLLIHSLLNHSTHPHSSLLLSVE